MEKEEVRALAAFALALAGVIGVTAYISGGMRTGREFLGFGLGIGLFALLTAQVWARIESNWPKGTKAARRGAGEGDERFPEQDTGRWVKAAGVNYPEHAFQVSWDRAARVFVFRPAESEAGYADTVWYEPSWGELTACLLSMEQGGWTPQADAGTRSVRARLDLPGWESVTP